MAADQTSESRATTRTILRRKAERGVYDATVINSILDEGLVCHVSVVDGDTPITLPTIYARVGDQLYLHGATGNHLLRIIGDGAATCIAVTLIDQLVLARSAFHHSMNYRSVVIFGNGGLVTAVEEKAMAVDAIVEHVLSGRSADVRPPTPNELRATIVVKVPITEASAKVRTGPPLDDAEDIGLPIWAGLIPLSISALPGIAAPDLIAGVDIPENVLNPPQRGSRR